ncbi:SDR family oxidoreductase [Vineibacter terrae]|uniref:SDR family oxidoreductase n=1 Tax=Vineibacter terrae TaxID=2586908 RepID=UPI002E2F076B|nr:SDR family oxidoreductase [Vineibacter terrae]HEX2890273.1 SDR family oxidoreductase [Vineibacter terrae]
MKLSGQVAIITGAASGIGRATVELVLREGARVVAVDRDAAALATLAGTRDEAACRGIAGDVLDEALARTAVDDAVTVWGRVDILVTAAGISLGKPALETSLTDWNDVMAVNLTGTFLWIRECLRPMTRQGSGAIVTLASQLARAGGRNNAAYVASKGAVLALTKAVALDYVDRGIRCNAVLPGATETPMLNRSFNRAADPDAARERSRTRHAMGRFGKPEEIAADILYLAGSDASFVTGVELPVDGGWLAA